MAIPFAGVQIWAQNSQLYFINIGIMLLHKKLVVKSVLYIFMGFTYWFQFFNLKYQEKKPKNFFRCNTDLCNKGASLKCISNGNLPDSEDGIHKERFAEKTVDCGDGTCGKITGPKLGSEPLYICGPPFEDGEKAGCVDIDGMDVCRCKTDFCTKDSSAGKLIFSYWSLIVFAVVISV